MNVWIITTGSSDVQLQNKNRWRDLYGKARKKLETNKTFSYSETEQNGKKLWRYPARATGVVYGQAITEHYADLQFPLLNSFSSYLNNEDKKIELNRIIVLLTDQSDVVSVADKNKPSHPYWQDTCTLNTILKQYLQNQFPDVIKNNELSFLVLKPEQGSRGLDDWNEVLTLVQKEFIKLNIPKDAMIYVSHQAGTPAISSAVQFESLAQFGQRVKFLVSSEYSQEITTIDNSAYLGAIQRQKAQALLEQHDYAAVKSLLDDYLDPETQILLNAAIQWNYAKFDEFATEIQKISDEEFVGKVNKRSQQWWWTAYEAAYLGVIRLKQENTVEAMFHSFRAVEGLLSKWAIQNPNITINKRKITLEENFILPSGVKTKKLNAYGQGLYFALEKFKGVDEINDKDIWGFGHCVFDERNEMFHQLAGLNNKEAVFEKWHISIKSEEEWEKRVLNCLNFIAEQEQTFNSLKEASLMSKVHEKLEIKLNSMSTSKSNKSE